MDICEIPRWQQIKSSLNNLSYADFRKGLLEDDNIICIDVRTPEEFATGHMAGARNVNYLSEHLADKLEELDADKTYYVYCRTSRRSLRVCFLLKNMGFKKVFHLEDGVKDYL